MPKVAFMGAAAGRVGRLSPDSPVELAPLRSAAGADPFLLGASVRKRKSGHERPRKAPPQRDRDRAFRVVAARFAASLRFAA